MQRRAVLAGSLTLATAFLAGCSEGDSASPTATDDDPEPTATPSATPTGTATPTAGTGEGDTATTAPTDTRSETPEERAATDDTAAGTSTPTPTATRTETEPASPTPTPTPTATPTSTGTKTASPSADQVVEVGPDGTFRFDPEEFEVAVGETVAWIWRAGGHNVKTVSTPDDSDWSGTPGGELNTFDPGYEHTHTFGTPGEYDYVCKPHESVGMRGSFAVTE